MANMSRLYYKNTTMKTIRAITALLPCRGNMILKKKRYPNY